jgi:chemotaxis protein MotB
MNTKTLIGIIAIGLVAVSCVSQKKYNELDGRRKQCEEEAAGLKRENIELKAENTEKTSRLEMLGKDLQRLRNDTTDMGVRLRNSLADYRTLNNSYEELVDNATKMQTGSKEEIQRILSELQLAQEKVIRKQDSLRSLEAELAEKQSKLMELQDILARKDAAVAALKQKVSDALLGFQGKGLTIEVKNGKVYVSLEESLLFRSGSWTVNDRGASALKELASVLETNQDINVVIEGHTDNVPYVSSGQVKDNWDLSVMRATAIVKIITKSSKINPGRLTAAGRSEYLPVSANSNADGRAKNRRTEIILTPKLDELFQILEAN